MRWHRRMVLTLAVVMWVNSSRPADAQRAVRQPAAPAQGAARPPAAPAQGAAKKPAAPPIDPDGTKMELLLIQWAKQSTQLRSLDV
jgi:hypothetical protein